MAPVPPGFVFLQRKADSAGKSRDWGLEDVTPMLLLVNSMSCGGATSPGTRAMPPGTMRLPLPELSTRRRPSGI